MTVVTRPPLVALTDELDAALQAGTVITPTRRLAREIAYAIDYARRGAGLRTWATPDTLSADAFLERCYRDCQDSAVPGAEALLLEDRILPFAVARAVPNPAWLRHVETFANAWRIANLYGLASVDPRLADTENGRAYVRWAHAFEGLLQSEGWITSAQLPDRLVRLIDGPTGWRPPPTVALGLDDAPPAVRRFLTASRTPSLALSIGPPAQSLRLVTTTSSQRGDTHPDPHGGEELAFAALWARERLAEEPDARIGVVVSALGPAFAAIERRFHATWPDFADATDYVNVSGGVALAQEPVCRDALELLAFTADGLDHDAVVALAASPFLELPLPDHLPRRARLDDLGHLPGLRPVRRAVETARKTGNWATGARAILDAVRWGRSGDRGQSADRERSGDSREIQATQQFDDCLADFAFGIEVGAIESWTTALDGLRRLANTRLFAPQASHAPIQVLGRAESIGLTFDHLWLAGMHQGGWPPVPEPNPLLPLAAQRAAGVPALSLEGEFARTARMTSHWRHAARHLIASHATHTDRDGTQAPSQLVADFEPIAVAEVVRRPGLATNGHPWASVRGIDLVDYVDADAGHVFSDAADTQAGGASVLQDQSLCPFRAWARHRLDLRDRAPSDRFPTEGERGAIVHRVLAELCRRHPERDDLIQVAPAEVGATVEGALPQRSWPAPYRERESTRLKALVLEWLGREARRTPFRVAAVEEPLRIDLGGLKLSLRIDRLDHVPAHTGEDGQTTGGNLLIDFKTGIANVNHWLGPRPEDPQLPLYAVARGSAVDGVAFARVRPGECRLHGVADGAAVAGRFTDAGRFAGMSFDALLGEWRETLTGLAEQYQAGIAAVDPLRPAVCRRCHLHALCRVFA